MADNVLWALEREGPGGRIVIWAHNSHIMKARDPKAGTRLGLFLDSMLGGENVNIGFTYYQGARSGWGSWQKGVGEPAKPSTLDGELARVGLPNLIINLRSVPKEGPVFKWLNQTRTMRGESSPEYDMQLNPIQAWDAIFYIHSISPAQVK